MTLSPSACRQSCGQMGAPSRERVISLRTNFFSTKSVGEVPKPDPVHHTESLLVKDKEPVRVEDAKTGEKTFVWLLHLPFQDPVVRKTLLFASGRN